MRSYPEKSKYPLSKRIARYDQSKMKDYTYVFITCDGLKYEVIRGYNKTMANRRARRFSIRLIESGKLCAYRFYCAGRFSPSPVNDNDEDNSKVVYFSGHSIFQNYDLSKE